MNIGSSGGIDIGQLFQNATNGLSQDGQALQAKMDQISASGEVDQMQAGDHLLGDQEHPGHAQVAGPADGLASGNGGVQARML